MAFRRKRTQEVRTCYICKEKKAEWTLHGGVSHVFGLNGKSCCDSCYPAVKDKIEKHAAKERNFEPSEADYSTWWNL